MNTEETKKFISLQHFTGNVSYIRADSIVYLHEFYREENGKVITYTGIQLDNGFEISVEIGAGKIIEAIAESPFFVHRDHVRQTKTITQAEHKPKRRHGVPVGYIGTADVRALLNKSATTIWKMINDGRLPKPLRDGKLRIWDRKELLRWIQNAKFTR